MRKGWGIKKLGEVCEFEGGSQPPKSNFIFEPRKGYVRFLQIRDFGSDNYITYIPISKKNRLCTEDDVLLGRYGASVGKVLVKKSGAYNVAVMKTIPNLSILNKGYLFYYFTSPAFQQRLSKVASRSAQAGFSKEDIYDFPVILPSLPEQQRIVGILDEAFANIVKTKENAEKNFANAREVFESYLQRAFDNQGKGWEEKNLQEVVDSRCTLSYGIVQPGVDFPNGLPVIRPTDLSSLFVHLKGLKLIDPLLANSYKRTMLMGNELLLCVRGNTGVISIASEELKGANVTRGIVPICFNSKMLNLKFGYYQFISEYIHKQIKEKTYGTALMQINIGDLRKIKMLVPPLSEQNTITQELDTLSSETKKLETIYKHKLADLDELKKSILEKAFAGEL